MENTATASAKKGLSGLQWFGIIAAIGLFSLFIVGRMIYTFAVTNIYDKVQLADVQVDKAWAEVINQYQRRSDLIPNLVALVSQAAGHENGTLKAVIEARARANSVQLTPEAIQNPEVMAQFSKYQGDLTTALSKLMMLTENYPNLKVNENFLNVQAQIEGTENRITVARNRYIAAVATRNEPMVTLVSGTVARFMGLKERPQFTVANVDAISTAPKIETYQAPTK